MQHKVLNHLSMLAVMLLLGGGVCNAKDDVTDQYIKDAGLADEVANWHRDMPGTTNRDGATNGNHGDNLQSGYRESWHNLFSISQTVENLPAGYYQVSVQAAGQNDGDNSTNHFTLTATSGNNQATAAYIKNRTQGDWANMGRLLSGESEYDRIFATVKVDEGQPLVIKMSQTNNNEWIVYGNVKLYKLTDEEGINAIAGEKVINPLTHWQINEQTGEYRGRREYYVGAEKGVGNIITFTVPANLPNGEYTVNVDAAASFTYNRGFTSATGDNLVNVFVNDASQSIPVVQRNDGTPEQNIEPNQFPNYNYNVKGTVTNGTLTTGIKNVAAGGNWFVFWLNSVTLDKLDATSLPTSETIPDDATGWTSTTGLALKTNTWSDEGNTDGTGMVTPFVENSIGKPNNLGSGDVSYTTLVQPGKYLVKGLVRVYNEANGSTTGASFFANDNQTKLEDLNFTSKTVNIRNADERVLYGTVNQVAAVGDDYSLKFGVRLQNAQFNWVALKGFSYAPITDAKVNLLEAIRNATKANASLNNKALTSAIEAAQTVFDNAEATDDEANSSISSLNSAIATASITDGADVTYKIVNPRFEVAATQEGKEIYGWNNDGGQLYQFQNNGLLDKDGDFYVEEWREAGDYDLNQTIEGLPAGTYKLSVLAQGNAGDNTSAQVYANDFSTDIKIGEPSSTYDVYFNVTDGQSVKIGFKTHDLNREHWVAFDNFKLTYAKPEAIQGKMNNEVAKAQTDAFNAYNANNTSDNLKALNAAVNNAKASVAAYQYANTVLPTISAYLEEFKKVTNFYSQAAYNDFYPLAAYNDGTLNDADAYALQNPNDYINPTNQFDGRYLRTATQLNKFVGAAWGFKDYSNQLALHLNTWSVEGVDDDSHFVAPFYEYWVDNKVLPDSTITGTMTGLEQNTLYKVSALVRIRVADNTLPATGVTMQVGEGGNVVNISGNQIPNNQDYYIDTYYAAGKTDAEGNLIVKFNITNNTNVNWLTFKNVWYSKLDAVTLDEDATTAPAKNDAPVIATLNRQFKEGWNSIVLPFATTPEALGAEKAAQYDGTEGNTIYFNTTETLDANTPYLVYFNEAKSNVTFSGVTINPETELKATDPNDQFDLVGTYTDQSANSPIKSGDYVVVKEGIQQAVGGNGWKAFRAYLQAQTPESAAKKMTISIDGGTVTGIEAMQIQDAISDGTVYNLSGQRVNKNYKGIVIKNGKKVINK